MGPKSFLLVLAFALLAHRTVAQGDVLPEDEQELLVIEIRENILAANVSALEAILSDITNVTTVARGFRFEEDEEDIFTATTPERVNDPDVVTIRAFAQAALAPGASADLLAQVGMSILFLEGPDFIEPSDSFAGFFESFSSPEEMQAILDADPTEEIEPDAPEPETSAVVTPTTAATGPAATVEVAVPPASPVPEAVSPEPETPTETAPGRRLLAVGKPASTPLCNSCFERKFCKKNAPWC